MIIDLVLASDSRRGMLLDMRESIDLAANHHAAAVREGLEPLDSADIQRARQRAFNEANERYHAGLAPIHRNFQDP
jgi:hypothetical protein